jgi:hypothetical protein
VRTIVLDAGAVLAAERDDRRFGELWQRALARDATILMPSTVVAETWRGSKTNPRIARLFPAIDQVPQLDLVAAKSVGSLLARRGAGRGHVIDAHVADVALANQPALVVTSDPEDIRALLPDGADVRILKL